MTGEERIDSPRLLSCADLMSHTPLGCFHKASAASDPNAGYLRDYSPAEVLNDMQMYGCERSMRSCAQGLSLLLILFCCTGSRSDALYVIDITSKLRISTGCHSAAVTSVYCDAMP